MKNMIRAATYAFLVFVAMPSAAFFDPDPLKISNIPLYYNTKQCITGTLGGDDDDMFEEFMTSIPFNTFQIVNRLSDKFIDNFKKSNVIKKLIVIGHWNFEYVGCQVESSTQWEDVEEYYELQLAKSNWDTNQKLTHYSKDKNLRFFTRGKQAVIIIFEHGKPYLNLKSLEDPNLEASYLTIVLMPIDIILKD